MLITHLPRASVTANGISQVLADGPYLAVVTENLQQLAQAQTYAQVQQACSTALVYLGAMPAGSSPEVQSYVCAVNSAIDTYLSNTTVALNLGGALIPITTQNGQPVTADAPLGAGSFYVDGLPAVFSTPDGGSTYDLRIAYFFAGGYLSNVTLSVSPNAAAAAALEKLLS